jgi:methylenetetrahydrofolate dehydrogenase (NADP+)/methenyltetrahydrofolate cyclohydrolase
MAARILDGKKVAETIRAEVAAEVAAMTGRGERPPGLAVLLVGDDPASAVYVGSKAKACEEAGIASWVKRLPADAEEGTVAAEIDRLVADPSVDGILVQLPLPKHLPSRALLERIDPAKDVDGFHPVNVGRLWLGQKAFVPCTPAGVIEMLEREGVAIAGSRAVIVGRSDIVGKPMAALLLQRHATVTICHSRTPDLDAVCREADLVVAAVGVPFLVGANAVREGAVVVDVGINRITDRAAVEAHIKSPKRLATFADKGALLVGDVDFEPVSEKAAAITPVPGGVGPLTVAMLLVNTLRSRQSRGV